jgi:hypothetical protein
MLLIQQFLQKYSLTHPAQNGMVEVAHRSVLRHLRHLISEDAAGPNSHLSWATLLSAARRIMMNTTNASTGETPNAFVYGGFCDTDTDMFLSYGGGGPLWAASGEKV